MIRLKKSSGIGAIIMLVAIVLAWLVYKNVLYLNNPIVITIAVTACIGLSLIDIEHQDR